MFLKCIRNLFRKAVGKNTVENISVDWLWNTSDLTKSGSDFMAISVGFPQRNHPQLHCGILHVDNNKKVSFLHLAWHSKLENELPSSYPEFLFVLPAIGSRKKLLVNAMCRRVWERYKEDGLPYGLGYSDGFFFGQEGILDLNGRCGLTCATFVLAILKSSKIDLLRLSDWPTNRQGDADWHNNIVSELKRTQKKFKISDNHIRNVEAEIGCARYRPQEVAGAIALQPKPVPCPKAEEIGAKIVAQLKRA
jgi:hypothetical protein